ncbi:MAG: autotransporter domain-containing protein [Oceanicaulis sp.]|uniref:autotransporter outer membrane beta-barrel domain-containing protein n=1 Tax=Glycocaulis sp. TaxID=1969725 RepID=UPI0025C0389B|nr:autotransporter outer membrane beta-barrel domain-containing protein [Glycocaulis sp.]MCC5980363.1 autotransporter domain-containing protein [Oceanicaulis sp.]MCH8521147.1 autotransporter outer membrane beta-barrel domain-containing protein [Glycocaulis sp.]
MRRRLLAAASVLVLASAPALADEEISDERTSPVRTSTSGDIVITSSGRVTLTDNPGPAVVVDSDNTLETRAGSQINVEDQDGAVGIHLESGREGGLIHAGSLSLRDEDVRSGAPVDEAIDSLTDETGKTGILVGSPGGAAFTGDVVIRPGSNVVVVGQDSYGVHVAAPLDGNLSVTGTISMTGESSTALAIDADISGDVRIGAGGLVQARGAGTTGLGVNADIDGALQIGGTVQANGFRISDRASRAVFQQLADRDLAAGEIAENTRLSQGAVIIAGSIREGVFIMPPQVGGSTGGDVFGTGSEPAMQIRPEEGASSGISLGEVVYEVPDTSDEAEEGDTVLEERGFGFVNDGRIRSTGVFDGVDSLALLIAGRDENGTIHAAVLAAGGLENTGAITAQAYDAHAEAIRIGLGAEMATITNSGAITATSFAGFEDDGFADPPGPGAGSATAVNIEAGANIGSIVNSGTISAQALGEGHRGTGILVQSNQLGLIDNTGVISAVTQTSNVAGQNELIAIDARDHHAGLTIRQSQSDDEDAASPVISGDILLGDGDDIVELLAGRIIGNILFGAGNNQFVLRDAEFDGRINSSTGQLTIDVENGSLSVGLTEQMNITSARFGDGAVLNLVLGGDSGANDTLVASGAISFEQGSELTVSLSELVGAGRTFQVLSAGTLTIAEDDVILEAVDTPFLYNASLERASGDDNALVLSLTRKTADEIGLDANRAVVYDAAISLFEDVTSLGNAIASIRDADSFYRAYDQLLPEYAASAIQFALAAHDAAAGALSTRLRNARLSPDQLAGMWIQEFGYFADRAETTFGPGYRGHGVGLAVGLDRPLGPFYAVGVTMAGAASTIEQVGLPHEPMTALMGQFSAYAAADLGTVDASISASIGIDRFETNRLISIGNFGGNTTASWSGWHYSIAAQAGRDFEMGNWVVRPELALTWLSINEDGFNEIAQGSTPEELALFVDSRTTSALTGGATLTAGRMFRRAGSWWLPYARVGYRGDFSGNSTTTTARFGENGTPFTLRASEMPSAGLLAGFGLSAGSEYTTFTFAYDADMRDDYISHVLRLVLRMNF